MDDLQTTLQQRLTDALTPNKLIISNESHLHQGHAGSVGGAQHFAVCIVSPQFNGITRLAQHRMIYEVVADLMPHPIHALRIDAHGTV